MYQFSRKAVENMEYVSVLIKEGDFMTEQTLFSLETLHTVSGASLAILLVVQLIKGLPIINFIPTKCLALFIGVILFLVTSKFPSTLGEFTVIVLNGILCAFTAIGGWHMISDFSTQEDGK